MVIGGGVALITITPTCARCGITETYGQNELSVGATLTMAKLLREMRKDGWVRTDRERWKCPACSPQKKSGS